MCECVCLCVCVSVCVYMCRCVYMLVCVCGCCVYCSGQVGLTFSQIVCNGLLVAFPLKCRAKLNSGVSASVCCLTDEKRISRE